MPGAAEPVSFEPRIVSSMAEAAAALPPLARVHLALPVSGIFFERMRLPSTNPEELLGMMRLQLEKTLPYPAEEVASNLIIVETGETESVVVAVALSTAYLDALSAPLRSAGRLPEKITVHAMHLASACTKTGIDLLVYREEEKFVAVITENGKIGFVQTLAAGVAGEVPLEIPQVLLGAELEGVPVIFTRVRLDPECAGIAGELGVLLGVPAEVIPVETPLQEPDMNLYPAAWQGALTAAARSANIKARLIAAGGVYLVILLVASSYLFWMNSKVAALDAKLRAIQPEVASIQARSSKWMALAPAVDPSRYTVELLYQIQKSMPSDSIRITQFDQTMGQFTIEGEAPTAALAVDYGEQLKANPDLKDFHFEVAPPAILPNEHAQFRIFSKL
jgi:hypothetical protein